ncbi:NADase-type glycan-binding domain-containing protein, partial [Streptomyces sp. 4N509B]|uniref:NADase-type glycan-binding domain-containing protein n=1 Tax=Streptomyces sp. 4N509B TaxID=3457413 RepID=UPI003FD50B05
PVSQPASPPAARPAAGAPATPDATLQIRAVTPEDSLSDRARRLVVPVNDPTTGPAAPPSVSPVLPGRPAATRPQVREVQKEQGVHGGLPCSWCGTANHPDRHFCVRCAMPMAPNEDERDGRRPWWRRMLDSRGREAPWAGERPRLRRSFENVLRWTVAVLVLALLVVLAVRIPDGIQATRDHFAKRAPVEPESYRALHSFEGHPAERAFDKGNDTWWGPGVSESGEGEWIQATFAEPTRLLDVLITPGVSTRANQLREQARPHRLEALITMADGSTTTREITLDQALGPQRRSFRAQEVTSVRFTILSAYGAAANKQVAIAEIEFFGPSANSIL